MKKTFIMLALCLVGVACNKEEQPTGANSTGSDEKIMVEFTLGATTKAMGPSDTEDDINDIQIYVFNSDGSFDTGAAFAGTEGIYLEVTPGTNKKIYAIANEGVTTASYSSIQELQNSFDNSLIAEMNGTQGFAFRMSGITDKVTIDKEHKKINITLDKILSKLTVMSVNNELPANFTSVKLKKMYLENVPAGGYYFKQENFTSWINKAADANLVENVWLNCDEFTESTIPFFDSVEIDQVFYMYPNYTTVDSFATQWCPRYTRLVVVVEINDTTYYYPISLNKLLADKKIVRNVHYEIEYLTIAHLGQTTPEGDFDFEHTNVEIYINTWGSENLGNIIL